MLISYHEACTNLQNAHKRCAIRCTHRPLLRVCSAAANTTKIQWCSTYSSFVSGQSQSRIVLSTSICSCCLVCTSPSQSLQSIRLTRDYQQKYTRHFGSTFFKMNSDRTCASDISYPARPFSHQQVRRELQIEVFDQSRLLPVYGGKMIDYQKISSFHVLQQLLRVCLSSSSEGSCRVQGRSRRFAVSGKDKG